MKHLSVRFSWLALACCLCAGAPENARAQTPPAAPTATAAEPIVGPLVLRDESVDQVLALLERWTGKTILRPQALPNATITVNLRESVTRSDAIRALETLLNLNGIALTPLGDRFLKVTALNTARSESPELIEGSTLGLPPSGRIASKIFQLNFLRVGEFMPQITQLLSANTGAPPVIFEKANAALVTDTVSNLQRIETLALRLDQPALGGMTPKFYNLSFAKASDVVTKMRTILSGALQSQLGTATSFNADDRTNQVILVSDPRQIPFFDDLIARLDVKSDPNTRNEVIYLKHAASKDVASILSQLVAGQNNAARTAGSDGSGRPLSISSAAANNPATPGMPPTPANVTAPAGAELGLEPSNQFSALLTILPEERSNSIVVSGTVDDIRLIHDLVEKIDVLLAQVRIEIVIAQVKLTDSSSSGIGELGLTVVNSKLSSFNIAAAGGSIPSATFSPGNSLDLTGAVNLVTTPRKINTTILSQPSIITTHNKEGKIFVGEQRPVISSYLNDSTTTGVNVGSGYRSTVSSKDIGIQLSVKPLIGNDGSVQLEIKQEVNDVVGEVEIDLNKQPIIGRRTTESFVSVKSGEIIVLGGLQRTEKSKNTNRLGPIPFLGDLFGSRSREDTRTDLVFFLRPTVLTNTPADNIPAMNHVERMPKEQRDRIHEALEPVRPSAGPDKR